MDTCRYCHKEYAATEFEIANIVNGRVYRRRKCRLCRTKARNERKARIRTQLIDYKKSHPCTVCGNSDYRVLGFHHLDPASKKYLVSEMPSAGVSWNTILAEIEKCHVVCANCHLILHA